jgi:hypothetical protein
MIAVVPDANLLWGRLASTRTDSDWQRLLGLSAAGEARLVLSEIVQWELVNQLREDLEKRLSVHLTATARLRSAGLTPPAFGQGRGQAAEILAEASERLRQEVLWSNGEIRAVPEIAHAELVRRSLERRPPFDSNDRGYRDTLLWHTVLELIGDGCEVILATNDARAFASAKSDSRLHPLLAAEVEAVREGASPVKLARSLGEAIELVCEGTGQARTDVHRALEDDEFVAELMKQFVELGDGRILGEAELYGQGWPEKLIGIRVTEIVDFGGLGVVSALSQPEGTLSAELSLRVRASLDARALDLLEYSEAEDLIDTGYMDDCGVALTDGLFQMLVTRDIELVGDVAFRAPFSGSYPRLGLRRVLIPRRLPGPGQLRLAIEPLRWR